MKSERGAMLIMVAITLVGLMLFSAIVMDYGVMWTARGQAQTAADAGALGGAIALAFDTPLGDKPGAKVKAQAVAKTNLVWGQAPDVALTDVTFIPPSICKPPLYPGVPDTCIKVDVFRNQARNNPLPIMMAGLAGLTAQGVVATATAQTVTGDRTDCMKPWAVLDRWDEFGPEGPGLLPDSTYDKYSDGKGQNPPPEPDVYIAPGVDVNRPAGTGFTYPADEGRRYAIKTDVDKPSSGWVREIQLPRADGCWTGSNCYNDNIETCGGLDYRIAKPGIACPADITSTADAEVWATKGCYKIKTGVSQGPTSAGVQTIIAKDANASYQTGTGIINSAFSPAAGSPRVVPIGLMDIDDYLSRNPTGSNGVARLVNIYGFFVEGMGDVDKTTGAITCCFNNGKAVIGRIMRLVDLGVGSSPIPLSASFLNHVILVR